MDDVDAIVGESILANAPVVPVAQVMKKTGR
jgi:hypothetical protein